MILYVILEIILFLIMIFYKMFIGETWLLHILNLLPILLTSFVVSICTMKNKNIVKPLYLIVMLAVLGDLCFIYLKNIYGIYFFFIIQLCLIRYLNKEQIKISYLIILSSLILGICYFLDNRYLVIEGILYVGIFMFNLVTLMKKAKIEKRFFLLLIAFIFLSICDFNVLMIFLIKMFNLGIILENFCFIIEWFFYIGFQIMLSLYISGIIKRKEIKS